MRKKILYLGNKLAHKGYTPTGIDTLGLRLEQEGFSLRYASSKSSKLLRLFDMLVEVIKSRHWADYVLIDTAGRLQNKKNLMEEYKKISKVTKKIDPNSPHEVLLVLDATTGQNSINQIEEFQKIAPITGIIMTKLDGTAKGGILIAVAKKFKIPIIALGLGEKEDDLQIFSAKDFAKAFVKT